MKIKVHDIKYDLSEEELFENVNAVLEFSDLNNFYNTRNIAIDKSIFDDFQPDGIITISFVEVPDVIFYYTMLREDYDNIYCIQTAFCSLDTFRDSIIAQLPTDIEITINDDIITEETMIDEIVLNSISDSTGFFVESLDYDIVED